MVLSFLGSEAGTLLLFILLIAAFVVAFKIMQMVFETILVSVIAAVFYISLATLFPNLSLDLSIDRILLFSFLGASLYMLYSILASMYGIASSVLGVPFRILKHLVAVPVAAVKKTYSYLRKEYRFHRLKKSRNKTQEPDEDSGDVKEVVLDKVRDD